MALALKQPLAAATGSRAGATVVIRHTSSESWELSVCAIASEDKSTVGLVALASPRSAQIRGVVSVQQWRIHGSVEDTKLSTNKQHTLSNPKGGEYPKDGYIAEGSFLFL